jgi:2-dehydro-3-deoxy-D-gluconate 5-dehydrogenase
MGLFDLTGKNIIVTGAVQGLGRGMAEGLHDAGAEVAIIDINEKVAEAAKEIEGTGAPVHAVVGNMADRKDLVRSFAEAVEKLGGRLDVLVNNAGIQRRNTCIDFTLEDWDDVLEVNLTAVFMLCQLAGRIMLKQGSGKIVNIASMTSFFGGYSVPAYTASKGAVAQLTKSLASDWAAHGINVNAIAPGYMLTELNRAYIENPKKLETLLTRIPAGRMGTPDDMKGVVVFLASRASDYVNGHILPVDGGYLAKG